MYLSLELRFRRKPVLAYVILYVLTLFFTEAIGQEAYSLPTVVNPSPQSMAFTRYGDYPMAAYTGLTDISVPLHNIAGRKLALPMSISFHASGRMANEVDGVLGIRWTLNCGGLVTRTMKGNPDEWSYLTPYTVDHNHEPSFDELYSACTDGKMSGGGYSKPFYDSEFDIFSYVLPNGKQGHFILKNENGVKVPMLMPYTPMKISLTKAATDKGYFERIEITDVDGTKYFFGKISAATANTIETIPEWDITDGKLGDVPTAWYLTKIVSNDGTDEMLLTYNTRYEWALATSQHATIYDRRRNSSTTYMSDNCEFDAYECALLDRMYNYYWEQSANNEVQTSGISKIVPMLSGVQFDGGSVSLSYSNDLLNEIVIKRESVPYKKIKFNLSKNTTGDLLYHLDSMAFYGEDQNTISEKYGFSYYEGGNSDPAPAAKKDWWGNYSQYVLNLLPYQPAQPVTYLVNGFGTQDVGFKFVERAPAYYSKIAKNDYLSHGRKY